MKNRGHLWGGALLVAGTAIGGGMLALPLLTARAGFLPSVVIFTLCWLFMVGTAYLFAEIFLWQKEENNIVSMARLTLGVPGQTIAWILYLFLFYALTAAYTAAGGNLVRTLFSQIPSWSAPALFVALFAPFVICGPRAVDRVNWVLMGGLLLSFCLFFLFGVRRVESALLQRREWSAALIAVPVVFTSFGFQGLVPTLTQYLNRNVRRVKRAIFWGSALPFTLYIVWEWLILGVVSEQSLENTRMMGQSTVHSLKDVLHLSWLYLVGEFFAFFAIVTSFLGVTLGLFDFLADGLHLRKTWKGKLVLATLIFLPTLIISVIDECLFVNALYYGGGFGCALLLGLLPLVMVYSGRYILKFQGERVLFGGKGLLFAMALFILVVLGTMFAKIA